MNQQVSEMNSKMAQVAVVKKNQDPQVLVRKRKKKKRMIMKNLL